MKLAIIEIDYHAEVLENTSRILKGTPIHVSVFTTQKIYKQVTRKEKFPEIAWQICTPDVNIKAFFLKNIDLINSHDIILFNTLASHYRFFSKYAFKKPVILRIHNANAYLNPAKSIDPQLSLFLIFKDISHIVRKSILSLDWYYRKKFLKKVNYFCFPDETINDYIIGKNYISKERIIQAIPLVHYSDNYQKKIETETVNIAVPGGIDPRRKDYQLLYNSFRAIVNKINTPVKLTLLGQPKSYYGRKIIRLFLSIENKHFMFQYFNNRVPSDEFASIMKNTDFLVLPICIKTRYTIYKELYGYTKISGSINDLIHYGKPSILPEKYPLNNIISKMCIQYKTQEDLSDKIYYWIKHKEYIEIQKNSNQILSEFNKNSIQKKFEEIIRFITNS